MTFKEVLRVLAALVWHCFMRPCELTILPWSLSCCFKEESVSWWNLGMGKCWVLSIIANTVVCLTTFKEPSVLHCWDKSYLYSRVQCKRKNQSVVLISSSLLYIRKYASNFWSILSALITWHPVLKVHSQASGHNPSSAPLRRSQSSTPKVKKSVSSRIHEAVKAIALCHNVTPVYEARAGVTGETEFAEADQDFSDENRTYQASSPDEVSCFLRAFCLGRVFFTGQTCVICYLDTAGLKVASLEQGHRTVLSWRICIPLDII